MVIRKGLSLLNLLQRRTYAQLSAVTRQKNIETSLTAVTEINNLWSVSLIAESKLFNELFY